MFVIEWSALLLPRYSTALAQPVRRGLAFKCIYPTAISIIHITNFSSTARLVKRKWQVTTVNIDKSIEHQQSHYKSPQWWWLLLRRRCHHQRRHRRRRMSDSLRKLSFPRSFDSVAAASGGGSVYIIMLSRWVMLVYMSVVQVRFSACALALEPLKLISIIGLVLYIS